MSNNLNNKKEEDALSYLENNFIDDKDEIKSIIKPDMSYLDNNVPSNEYITIPLDILPCGMFYKNGSKLSIRAARVQEVQAYSIVDNKNYLDITEKMNQILSCCVKFYHQNGKQGSYKDSAKNLTDLMDKDLESVKKMATTGENIPDNMKIKDIKDDFYWINIKVLKSLIDFSMSFINPWVGWLKDLS